MNDKLIDIEKKLKFGGQKKIPIVKFAWKLRLGWKKRALST